MAWLRYWPTRFIAWLTPVLFLACQTLAAQTPRPEGSLKPSWLKETARK